ncbi:outer membrane protein assembly factor BamB family protein [Oryzibacter oryziterrae]|uniref:outer membrane protein assembly factor BamB family protein n=1 Tax=Oryzibacter oryziterrae TaxID=2766474 RepID=UPI001F1A7C0E|nr:PQQ-binding-like beta-propeller repeat protein [Oryzibacter oryziterrae]
MMTTRRLRISAALLALLPLLAACGTDGPIDAVSNLNPFKKAPLVDPGNRKPLLEVSDPTRGITNGVAKIGAATASSDWPQVGGPASNDPGNVAGSIQGVRYWSLKAGASGFGSEYMGMSSSRGRRISARPVASGGLVYVYDASGVVSGYKIANGGAAWHVSAYPSGQSDSVSGGGLAVSGNQVLVATGYGEVLALDKATSNILWRVKIDAPARSAPAVGGGKVIVMSQAGTVNVLDQATGASVWKASTDVSGASLLGSMSAAVTADTVIVPGANGQVLAFDLKTGAPKWQATIAGGSNISAVTGLRDASASPVVHGDTVYATGVGGALVAISLKTGETVWQQQIGSADTPVVSGDSLFLLDLEGRMIAVNRLKGNVIWATELPDTAESRKKGAWAGPVMAGGKLYAVSNDGRLAIVDAATGAVSNTANLGYAGAIAPILASGKMLVLGGDGLLAAVN